MLSPLIGIVGRKDFSQDWKKFALYGQGRDYCASVARAGGAPVIIPLEMGVEHWRSMYERLDGLLLPGGVDVDPAHFGESPHRKLGRVDEALDEVELILARWALADNRPVFGVCRGIQVLNVAAGGTLYQDIPTQIPGAKPHSCSPPKYPRTQRVHTVQIEPGTRLAAALGTTECWTNSRHHQAVKDVAPGFEVTAHAPDGIIEGFEKTDAPFIVGVQWHPENLTADDDQMLGLFRAFVDACRTHT